MNRKRRGARTGSRKRGVDTEEEKRRGREKLKRRKTKRNEWRKK